MSRRGVSGFGSVDGELGPLSRLVVPATDRGFLLGDAVFETLRTYDGRLFALGRHLDRLEASLRGVRIPDAPGRDTIAAWAREAVRATREETGGECVVRITVTRGSGPPGISVRDTGPARVVVTARPLPAAPDRLYEVGLRVVTARVRRAPAGVQDPTIKATSALNLILARLQADEAGVDEALMTDARGDYLEASAANLFVLGDRVYWTPRGEHGVLEGVTAAVIEEILHEEGWEARLGPVPPRVLHEAREVLLTQTTREVLPVVAVDARRIAGGRPGPMAAALRQAFSRRREGLVE